MSAATNQWRAGSHVISCDAYISPSATALSLLGDGAASWRQRAGNWWPGLNLPKTDSNRKPILLLPILPLPIFLSASTDFLLLPTDFTDFPILSLPIFLFYLCRFSPTYFTDFTFLPLPIFLFRFYRPIWPIFLLQIRPLPIFLPTDLTEFPLLSLPILPSFLYRFSFSVSTYRLYRFSYLPILPIFLICLYRISSYRLTFTDFPLPIFLYLPILPIFLFYLYRFYLLSSTDFPLRFLPTDLTDFPICRSDLYRFSHLPILPIFLFCLYRISCYRLTFTDFPLPIFLHLPILPIFLPTDSTDLPNLSLPNFLL